MKVPKVPVIDVNTGKVIKTMKKKPPKKVVFEMALTFHEFEQLYAYLESNLSTVDTDASYRTRWERGTFIWKRVLIKVEGNSMFLGGGIRVKANTKKEWTEFLRQHHPFKKMLENFKVRGEVEYDEDREEYRRESDDW